MINRNEYLNKLIQFKDKNLIKVITGIRRCGKSTLFKLFQNYLLENEIQKDQIININFEDIDFESLTDYKKLYEFLSSKLIKNKKNYIFLDEIQNVKDFQKVVDSLYIKENVDLYITGSNAFFLSGELATLLSGRYVEIKMLPLSFKEYLSAFNDNSDLARKFRQYFEYGGFPYTLELGDSNLIKDYLSGIYSTVVLKDVVARKKISDVSMLESVIKFIFDNIGNITSIKKIADTMTSMGRKITSPTIETYLSALIDSFILYKIGRYDIAGKQYLKTAEKFYLVDMGLKRFLLGTKKNNIGHTLENIVFLELLRRGYEIYIGKIGTLEVDFIGIKNGITQYFQVSQTVLDENTLERELKPLMSIKDHNEKFLLTLDEQPLTTHNGIKQINIIDWLLDY